MHEASAVDPAAWERLADRGGRSPFVRPGWISIWHRHFGGGPLRLLIAWRDGRAEALLPLVERHGWLLSPTNEHTPSFDILAADAAAASGLLRRLFALRRARVELSQLDASGPYVDVALEAARAEGASTVVRRICTSPFVRLSEVGDGVASNTGSAVRELGGGKLNRDLDRRRRRLDEAGRVEFRMCDGREGLDRLLREGFDVEPSGWKAERGTAILSNPSLVAFYTDVARWAAARGTLRLAFLRLDGRPLAFQFGIEEDRVYYFLKGGFDPEMRTFAPGKLLLRDVLGRALAAGLVRFEFLGEAESWKMEWTETCRSRVALEAFGAAPTGRLLYAACRHARPLAKRLRAAYRRRSRGSSP